MNVVCFSCHGAPKRAAEIKILTRKKLPVPLRLGRTQNFMARRYLSATLHEVDWTEKTEYWLISLSINTKRSSIGFVHVQEIIFVSSFVKSPVHFWQLVSFHLPNEFVKDKMNMIPRSSDAVVFWSPAHACRDVQRFPEGKLFPPFALVCLVKLQVEKLTEEQIAGMLTIKNTSTFGSIWTHFWQNSSPDDSTVTVNKN